MRRITCPHCGHAGKIGEVPDDGAKIRCSRCRGLFAIPAQEATAEPPSVFQPSAELPPIQSGDWVEASVIEGLGRRVVVLEKRNRLLAIACGVLGVLCLASLLLQLTRRERFADYGETFIQSQKNIGAPGLSALSVATRRLEILDDDGILVGVFGSKVIDGQNVATLEVGGRGDKAGTTVTPKAIMMRDASNRLRITMASSLGGRQKEAAFIGLLNENLEPAISLRTGFEGNEVNVFDPGGELRLNLGAPFGSAYMRYMQPGDVTPSNLVSE